MKTNPNEPAFPMDFSQDGYKMNEGLTKREYFSGLALQGILSNSNFNGNIRWSELEAVQSADALINELNKEK